jgi:hypothetical protein
MHSFNSSKVSEVSLTMRPSLFLVVPGSRVRVRLSKSTCRNRKFFRLAESEAIAESEHYSQPQLRTLFGKLPILCFFYEPNRDSIRFFRLVS